MGDPEENSGPTVPAEHTPDQTPDAHHLTKASQSYRASSRAPSLTIPSLSISNPPSASPSSSTRGGLQLSARGKTNKVHPSIFITTKPQSAGLSIDTSSPRAHVPQPSEPAERTGPSPVPVTAVSFAIPSAAVQSLSTSSRTPSVESTFPAPSPPSSEGAPSPPPQSHAASTTKPLPQSPQAPLVAKKRRADAPSALSPPSPAFDRPYHRSLSNSYTAAAQSGSDQSLSRFPRSDPDADPDADTDGGCSCFCGGSDLLNTLLFPPDPSSHGPFSPTSNGLHSPPSPTSLATPPPPQRVWADRKHRTLTPPPLVLRPKIGPPRTLSLPIVVQPAAPRVTALGALRAFMRRSFTAKDGSWARRSGSAAGSTTADLFRGMPSALREAIGLSRQSTGETGATARRAEEELILAAPGEDAGKQRVVVGNDARRSPHSIASEAGMKRPSITSLPTAEGQSEEEGQSAR